MNKDKPVPVDKITELLKPRYKVIADYPANHLGVGFIVPDHFAEKWDLSNEIIAFYEKYPHLFKKLEWWEDRKKDEMPEYVKSKSGKVLKVQRHCIEVFYYLDYGQFNNEGIGKCVHYLPATKEEYKNQNNSK